MLEFGDSCGRIADINIIANHNQPSESQDDFTEHDSLFKKKQMHSYNPRKDIELRNVRDRQEVLRYTSLTASPS